LGKGTPVKVKANELRLGDTLADGSRVVGRQRRGLLLARPDGAGFSREVRFVFDWPSGDPKEVSLSARLDECDVCGQGAGVEGHELCQTPKRGPSLDQAVDALLTLGGRLIEPAAIGKFGPWHPALRDVEFCVFDLETTGLHRADDRVVEIAAIRLTVRGEISRFESLVDPGFPMPEQASAINGIYDADLVGAPTEKVVIPDFATFSKGAVLVGHNIGGFDLEFMSNASARCGVNFDVSGALDTLRMARGKPGKAGLVSRQETESFKLVDLAKILGIPHESAHRAMGDVKATVGLLDVLLKRKYRSTQEG
jgi:DNA polymerase-3 subunit epsilon